MPSHARVPMRASAAARHFPRADGVLSTVSIAVSLLAATLLALGASAPVDQPVIVPAVPPPATIATTATTVSAEKTLEVESGTGDQVTPLRVDLGEYEGY